MTDVVEGKKEYDNLSSDYKRVFNSLLILPQTSKGCRSWFHRGVDLFKDIIKNRKNFSKYGYCSMESFLFHSIWAHFFDREVKI